MNICSDAEIAGWDGELPGGSRSRGGTSTPQQQDQSTSRQPQLRIRYKNPIALDRILFETRALKDTFRLVLSIVVKIF